MTEMVSATGSSFVVNVGDNFYQNGVTHPRDRRWQSTFEQLFNSKTLSDIYWYNVLGNHDWKANLPTTINAQLDISLPTRTPLEEMLKTALGAGAGAQVAHTFVDPRWCMPGLNYTVTIPISKGVDVKLVMFDTQVLVRTDPDDIPNNAVSKSAENVYAGNSIPKLDAMLEWLESELCSKSSKSENGNEQWLITVGHHFVVSTGNYFAKPVFDVMLNKVAPLFERCGVHMHIHGHDHVSQVVRLPGGTLQVGVGSAGKTNGAIRGRQNDFDRVYGHGKYQVLFASVDASFVNVAVSREKIEVELWGVDEQAIEPLFRGDVQY